MRTLFESGAIDRLGEIVGEFGSRRILVVTSPSQRFVPRALASLGHVQTSVFDEARVHVPSETVADALAALDAFEADTVIAVGGGAAVGLGKVLKLKRSIPFIAIPTTYSGSEMTSIYGIREEGVKKTGRSADAAASLVVYDASLTTELPLALSLQSLTNSMAQIVSALSTQSIAQPAEAVATVAELFTLMKELPTGPTKLALRERALRAASKAGAIVDAGTMGAQHKLAHSIGGHFDLVHSNVHSVLLPSFMAWMRREAMPALLSLDEASGSRELEAEVYDLLRDHGAAVSLRELKVPAKQLRTLLVDTPTLPQEIAWDAYLGIRPCSAATIERRFHVPVCIRFGPTPKNARRTIVALHGRGANAGRMLRDLRAVFNDADDLAYVIPQAPDCSWYPRPYTDALDTHGSTLATALQLASGYVDEAVEMASEKHVVLFGFSQGACLACELAARRGGHFGGIIAICGARIGRPEEQRPSEMLNRVPVLLGSARKDPWLDMIDIRRTAGAFAGAGAVVQCLWAPGDAHTISKSQAAQARALIADATP